MDPRNVPSLFSSSSPIAWLFLLTITLQGQPPIRLVNNNEEITSRGNIYSPFPFALNLPEDTGDRLPKVTLSISNISREIVDTLRAQTFPPAIIVELISSAYPDIIEKRLDFLQLRSVNYDAITITGQLEVVNVLTRGFPSEVYDPVHFPGLFR
jgi:Domain of unknown function (DUF1833)